MTDTRGIAIDTKKAAAREYGLGTPRARATAATLRDLAARPELAARSAQLESLARALTDEKTTGLWRDVPLRAAFGDAATPPSGDANPSWLRALSVLRLLFVFLPVAMTWWFIHLAAEAYQGRLAADPALPADSFFREWLTGFGGELWWTFGRMAQAIVLAMGALVAVWLFVDFAYKRRDARTDAVTTELETALTEAGLHLTDRSGTPTDVVNALASASKRMDRLVDTIVDASAAIEKTVTDLAAASGSVREAAQSVDASAQSATTAIQGAGTAVETVTAGLSGTAADLTGALDRHQKGIAEALREGQTRLLKELAELTRLVAEHDDVAVNNREQVGRLLQEHKTDLTGTLPRLLERMDQAVTRTLIEHRRELGEVVKPLLDAQSAASAASTAHLAAQVAALAGEVRRLAERRGELVRVERVGLFGRLRGKR